VRLDTLRTTLAVPGLRPLLLVATTARMPVTAMSMALTFQVVSGLHRGYGGAGAVIAAITLGTAVGAPLLGRLTDRRGLRPTLAATVAAQALFWGAAPALPYPGLVAAALLGGLLAVPVHAAVRQGIAALVPAPRRRQAYALDSISVEVAFMTGPPLVALLAAMVSPHAAVYATGAGIVLAGLALLALDPPVRAGHETAPGPHAVSMRQWLTPQLAAAFASTAAAMLVLGGTDIAVVAALREAGQVSRIGLVLAVWCACSIAGGLVGGASARAFPVPVLLALLSLATIPVGLAAAGWWQICLALIPAGLLCAPAVGAAADAVSRCAPAEIRATAISLHGSFSTAGVAMGAPLAGAIGDAWSPAWSFVAIGLVGAVVAVATSPTEERPTVSTSVINR
jgi:MFS family permease